MRRRGASSAPTTTTTAATGAPVTAASSEPTAPTTTSPAFSAGPARFVRAGPTDRRAVAFTFHGSGDVGLLDELLAVAASRRAPVTIFAVGTWLDENPALARHILGAGHELANHTFTHPSLGRLDSAQVAVEITRCRDALTRHAGMPGRWFRPSGIEVPTAPILTQAARAGYATVVGYDVDPRDYQDPGAAAVRSRTAAGIHAGAIVSLHTGHRGTVDALAAILDDAAGQGLRPVTVSQLLTP